MSVRSDAVKFDAHQPPPAQLPRRLLRVTRLAERLQIVDRVLSPERVRRE